MSQPSPEDLKRVATEALRFVEDDMILGLGTGRAAEAFIRVLAERVKEGLRVTAVPTSDQSDALARQLGIVVVALHSVSHLDIAFDGADEVTPDLSLTKGLGGALLRERVVAHEARRFVVLVTPEKRVDHLGTRAPIPIEVVPFAQRVAARNLEKLGGRPALRKQKGAVEAFVTDNGNVILDLHTDPIRDPHALDASIRKIPGIVDTGLFLNMASVVLVGEPGKVIRLET